jgi:outer membrane protein TolC
MIKKVILLAIIIIIILVNIILSQDKPKPMTLEECLILAMEKNLGLQVQVLQPERAGLSVSLAAEKFLPSLSFQYDSQNVNAPSFSWIDAADAVLTKYSEYTAALVQAIPTGGQIRASLGGSRSDTNRNFQTINPRYGSQLSFSFAQPLLKDFGFKISRKEIIAAQNNKDIAENGYRMAVLDTLYTVEEAYWNLVFNSENLKVKRQSLKLARGLLERNKKELEIGMMAPIDILSAQADVATREADILQAEVQEKNSEDTLRTLLNLKDKEGSRYSPIVPADAPSPEKREVSMESALAQAMANRPELQSAKLDMKNKELDLTYSRNQLLPDLIFRADYWSPGISGTQILYAEDNPLTGIIIGQIPGQSRDALKDALKFKYKNWAVGLTFSLPLNTVFSRALAAQARVNVEEAAIRLAEKEQQVFLEVRNAAREVETNAKRVEAYAAARTLAEKTLEAEERKAKAGLSTNYLVLLNQRDLANAQTNELRARIDYVLSLARLDKATGTSLEKRNIKLVSK